MTSTLGTTLSVTAGESTYAVGKIKSVSDITLTREALDCTTLDSTCKTYIPGLSGAEEITIQLLLDKQNAAQSALKGLYTSGAVAVYTVTFPDTTALSFSAFIKSLRFGGATAEGIALLQITLQATGGAVMA